MTNISLRSYTREIEKQIDNGQADQAIAHCRHILKSYPKCVDAYRLLGKAYLESQRYGDAADIFQRVLSSVPGDFVSHVGMSLIREDEGNLDQAIWHMERAFEVQPSNSAIQGELRRLYGRRDGMEPPKIRLTRGALARMYARGELFQQAVAEIRAALAENPNRLDLITSLASVYAQAGQKAEAVEMCNGLLRKLPYSLDGNRIMGEMLKNTDRVQDLQVYKRRLVALNPYYSHLSPTAPNVDSVPDQSVSIERLQWSPGMNVEGPASQPEWAASLGVQLSGMTSEKDILPDWLLNLEESASEQGKPLESSTSGQSASAFDNESLMQFARETQKTEPTGEKNEEPATKPLIPSPEEVIPDWMKEAGWQPSSGEAQEGESLISFSEDEDFIASTTNESGLAEANIPEWLKAMAPTEASDADSSEFPGDELAWLDNHQTDEPVDQVEGESEQAEDWLAESEIEVPDWLKEFEEEKPEDELIPTKPLTEKPTTDEPKTEELAQEFASNEGETEDLPVSPPTEPAEAPEEEESTSRTLMEGMSGPDARAANQAGVPQTQEEPAAETGEEIPEWLRDLAPEDESTPTEEATTSQVPEWLQSLAPTDEEEEPAAQETVISEGAEPEETQEAAEVSTPESVDEPIIEEETVAAEQTPEMASETETQVEAEPGGKAEAIQGISSEEESSTWDVEGADDAFAWLESLAVKQGAEEALLLNPEDRKENPPDWVQSDLENQATASGSDSAGEEIESGEPAEVTAEGIQDLTESEIPETPITESQFEEGQPTESEAVEVPDWLQELGPQGTEGTETGEAETELPDWINAQPESQEAQEPYSEATAEGLDKGTQTEAEPAEIPDWLQELEAQGSEEEVTPQPKEEEGDLPEWIRQAPDLQASEESPQESLDKEPQTEGEPAELPDWLQALEPQGSEEEVTPQPKEEEGELPEWVSQAPETQATETFPDKAQEEDTRPKVEPAELPDWLQALEPQGGEEEVAPQPEEEKGELSEWVSQATESPVPEALTEEPPEEGPMAEAEPAEIPDWLQTLEPQGSDELDEALEEAQIPAEEETLFSESPPILGDTKPVKVKPGSQPPVAEPEFEPEEETKAEAEALSQETPPAMAESGQALEEMEEKAESDEIMEAAQAAQQTEIGEEPEAVAGLEGEVAQETTQETVEEPAAVVDEWQPEEPEAAQSEDVESMLSEMQDSDDAFAWLESLAVRQGADEALLLNPDERSETPPEWVQAEIEETDEPSPLGEPTTLEQAEAEGEPEELEEAAMGEPDTAEEAISPEELSAMEAETEAEELQASEMKTAELPDAEWSPDSEAAIPEEEMPGWLEEGEPNPLGEPSALEQAEAEGEPGELEQAAMVESDTTEEAISPEETPAIEAETEAEELQTAELQASEMKTAELPAAERGPESEAAVPEEEMPDWLEEGEPNPLGELSTLGEPSAPEQPETIEQPAAEAESGEEIPELPDWLQEDATESGEETAWTPPVFEPPMEKLDLNQASLVELERLPDIGFRMAQSIVNYRDSFGNFKTVDDLLNIPGMGPEMLDDIREWLYVTAQPEEAIETPPSPISEVESGEAPPEILEARQQISSGDLEQAAQSYTQLIKNNIHLDAIIQDLQVATEHHPEAIFLWQALGDAHLRAGQIQPALDAYNQAEKLLS